MEYITKYMGNSKRYSNMRYNKYRKPLGPNGRGAYSMMIQELYKIPKPSHPHLWAAGLCDFTFGIETTIIRDH